MSHSPPSQPVAEAALRVLRKRKTTVFIVAYNAERHIEQVLRRIPPDIAKELHEIYLIDDSSDDRTAEVARDCAASLGLDNFKVFRTPMNRGYGGNQILGYTRAIERDFDIVAMLHGDGQYPPERLAEMIAPFDDESVNVVLGSRMLKRLDALRGRMPFYKWLGNQILTWFENKGLGVALSEFHTGYRAYRVNGLRRLPFEHNTADFHFDTEILIQCISAGFKIVEVPIPTFYGDEKCHVPGLRYAWNCVKSIVKYRLFKMGLFYTPFLDIDLFEEENYYRKSAANSLHQYVLRREYKSGERVLDLGAAKGRISAEIAKSGSCVTAVDFEEPEHAGDSVETIAFDLNGDLRALGENGPFDTVLALDVIEHLARPEEAAQKIAEILKPGGVILASTGNIGFFVMRAMLLIGQFHYGKRGILDKTHTRLFSVGTFKRLLNTHGFEVLSVRGFGPPIRDLISSRWPFSWIDSCFSVMARLWPSLLSYSFLVEARRLPTIGEIGKATFASEADSRSDGPPKS